MPNNYKSLIFNKIQQGGVKSSHGFRAYAIQGRAEGLCLGFFLCQNLNS